MEKHWFPAPMLRLAISSPSLHFFFFFSETLHDNLTVARGKQLDRSMKKTTSCKKATELLGWTSSLIGQKNNFLPNQREGIRPLLELDR